MVKKNVNLNKIARMGVLAFENSLRLHRDAILLFNHNRFPSAYTLSILSLEELGKYYLLEDFVWHSLGNGRLNPQEERKFISSIYIHRSKQGVFVFFPEVAKKLKKQILSGELEKSKQDSIYIGFHKKIDLQGKISIPMSRISKKKAEKQITFVNDFIICLALGVIKGFYSVDICELEELLTYDLISQLKGLWPIMSASAKSDISSFMKHPDMET